MKKIRIPINFILFIITFIIAIIPASFTYIPIIKNELFLHKIKSDTLELSTEIIKIIADENNNPNDFFSQMLEINLDASINYSKQFTNKHRYNLYILNQEGNIIEKTENILVRDFSSINSIYKDVFFDDFYFGSEYYCGKKNLNGAEIDTAKTGINDFKIRHEIDLSGNFNLINTTTYTSVPFYLSDSLMYILLIVYDVEKPLFHYNSILDFLPSIFSICFTIILGLIFYFTINKKLILIAKKTKNYAQQEGHISNARINVTNTNYEIKNISEQFENLINIINSNMDYLETFSSDISHELKNPIASIKLNAEYLLCSEIPCNSKSLQPIQEELSHIEKLIYEMSNNIIINNKQKEIKDFNYRTSLDKIIKKEENKYPNTKITYNKKAENNNKLIILEEHFERIFENLIDNAASFANDVYINEIKTEISNISYISITVEDSGPGISKSDEDKIFNRFYSNRTLSKENNTHSGIGLSTVKVLVELYNGKISLSKSSLLGGACFNILLKSEDL